MSTLLVVSESKNSQTVAQGNFIVRSHLAFGTVEARIFTHMLAGIHKDDNEFKPIEIPFSAVTNQTGGTAYEMVDNACKGLMTKFIEATEDDRKKGTKYYSFVDTLGIDRGKATITGEFSASIRPYLLQLKDNFTLAEIEHLLDLKSGQSHRMYWLLKSYESLGQYEETVDELKNRLCGKKVKYDRYFDFKKNVLLPAFAEIQKTEENPDNPIAFDFIEIKTGRKITSIKFLFDGAARQLAVERKANKGKKSTTKKTSPDLFAQPVTPPKPIESDPQAILADLLKDVIDQEQRSAIEKAFNSMVTKKITPESAALFLTKLPAQKINNIIYHKYSIRKEYIQDSTAFISKVLWNEINGVKEDK